MKNFYYTISSLPELKWGAPPSITMEKFFSICANFLSVNELQNLKNASLIPPSQNNRSENKILEKWYDCETFLRNRIARTRAKNKNKQFHPKPEKDFYSEIDKVVQNAFSSANPLEKEKILDSQRWKILENLSPLQQFCFEKLIIYKLKLELLAKISSLNKSKGLENLDIYENILNNHSNKQEKNG